MHPSRHHRGIEQPDPLTDSGVLRLDAGMGTQVSLHMLRGEPVVVPLLGIKHVSTWSDLTDLVIHAKPIIVESPVRITFGGGVILWAECVSDRSGA